MPKGPAIDLLESARAILQEQWTRVSEAAIAGVQTYSLEITTRISLNHSDGGL